MTDEAAASRPSTAPVDTAAVAAPPGADDVAAPPPTPPATAAPNPGIPLVSTGRLLTTSFDLLGRSGADMRRASFYIGLIVLGTVGPLALATWGLLVVDTDLGFAAIDDGFGTTGDPLFFFLGLLALIGLVVAAVESRILAMTVLAGRMVDRPVSTRRALARSRRTFWYAIVASFLAGLPVYFVQTTIATLATPIVGEAATAISSTGVSALIGAPFAYVVAGVVLGDVDPFEALRRSFRVFRARKLAAVVVVVFEAVAVLLVLVGIDAGLGVAFRFFEALGLGPESGPIGVASLTIAVVAVTFAVGTLIYTVMAITVAPQVVMFLSLTHATNGLDRVRPGGVDDPDIRRPGRPLFRWLTRPMLLGFVLGGLALAMTLATVTG